MEIQQNTWNTAAVFESLSNVQAGNIKRITLLYTLNFDKTNSIVRENVEI